MKPEQDRIARAKELLQAAKHGCMATTNEDDTPHATPFYLIFDKDLQHIYFGSHPESLHSRNVARTGDMFVAIYDKTEKGGLYIKAVNGKQLSGKELEEGLAAHNATRARHGKQPIELSYYEDDSSQRMYGADIVAFWVNVAERDDAGRLLREYRHEVSRDELLEAKT